MSFHNRAPETAKELWLRDSTPRRRQPRPKRWGFFVPSPWRIRASRTLGHCAAGRPRPCGFLPICGGLSGAEGRGQGHGRRNLTPDQRSILRGRRYNRTKKSHGAEPGTKRVKSQSDTLLDTAAALGAQHGVSRATVIRDGTLGAVSQEAVEGAAKVDPAIAAAWIENVE